MKRLFGTDGIRGAANKGPLSPGSIVSIGMAAGRIAAETSPSPRIVIGKDTRESGYMVEAALVAGLTAVGANPILLGPIPTPATSWLTRSMRADLGIMITASHNPHHDNGLKFFDHLGRKIDDAAQHHFEDMVRQAASPQSAADPSPDSHTLGRASRVDFAIGRYVEAVKQTIPRGLRLNGIKIVLDCANGAGYRCAPEVLWELGADVTVIGNQPNGRNINSACGATATAKLRATVIEEGADIGIALDGDGDRVIVCDEYGQEIDGDQILCLIAERLNQEGRLRNGKVAATVMSNLGLERHLGTQQIGVVRTPVGDRQLAMEMSKQDLALGGEPSGHVILSDYAHTGDGLMAALQVLTAIVENEAETSQLCHRFEPVPQIHRNVRLTGDKDVMAAEKVVTSIADYRKQMGSTGRLVVRKSGTEPLVRIMVESVDRRLGISIADALEELVTREAG
ncbi:MAG: phosphoglucosamine mutase [Alphaproteobacteria bacterium]|nr:phosphoglucosamine mutase [Alphaproteobacteria bacterium]